MSLIFLPSRKSSPDVISYNLGIKLIKLVFPDPVCPTIATVEPTLILRLIFLSISGNEPAYLNETFLNSISPFNSLVEKSVEAES
jgi:hypothetical protein